eukprot:4906416-Amphidinium_carterae.1
MCTHTYAYLSIWLVKLAPPCQLGACVVKHFHPPPALNGRPGELRGPSRGLRVIAASALANSSAHERSLNRRATVER